jgi:hypothetical protein
MKMLAPVALALVLGASLSLGAQAQNAPRPDERPRNGQRAGEPPHQQGEQTGRPHRPPPEALDACKSLAAGAACGFTSPRGAVKGTCFAPEGRPLACRPGDRPEPRNDRAPAPSGKASAPAR